MISVEQENEWNVKEDLNPKFVVRQIMAMLERWQNNSEAAVVSKTIFCSSMRTALNRLTIELNKPFGTKARKIAFNFHLHPGPWRMHEQWPPATPHVIAGA